MGHVEILSEIPAEHPRKGGAEEAFRTILGPDPASWTVLILLIHGTFWTVFVIRDDDGFRKVLLLDEAREQRPDFIAASLRTVLDEARSNPSIHPPADYLMMKATARR